MRVSTFFFLMGIAPAGIALTACKSSTTSGSAGGGGTEPTANSQASASTGSSQAGGASSSLGEGGAGGSAGTWGSSAATGSGGWSMSGSGGSAGDCTHVHACGTTSEGCVACAEAGPCYAEAQACFQDQQCADYQSCLEGCTKGDDGCAAGCAQQEAQGAEEYGKLYACTICQQCLVACGDALQACVSN